MRKRFLIKLLSLILLVVYCNCAEEKELEAVKISRNEIKESIKPQIVHFTSETVDSYFHHLSNELNIATEYSEEIPSINSLRTTQDTLGYIVYTDNITQVTLDNYVSYTMQIVPQSVDGNNIYNLTIEDKNGTIGMFVTEYIPNEEWLNDKSTPFEGQVNSSRTQEITDEHPGDGGTGESGEWNVSTHYYQQYPSNCDGWVDSITSLVEVGCTGANPPHFPGDNCRCGIDIICSPPGYALLTTYACIPHDQSPPDTGNGTSNNGNNGPAGVEDPNNGEEDPSLGVLTFVDPEECDPPLYGDLNGDCRIIGVEEMCLKIKELIEGHEDFSDDVDFLETKLNASQEQGFAYKRNGIKISLTDTYNNGHSLKIPASSDMLGFVHSHLRDEPLNIYDKDNNQLFRKRIRMFSPRDLVKFLQLVRNAHNNQYPYKDIFGGMISSQGNYLLKFSGDINNFIQNFTPAVLSNLLTTDSQKEYERLIKDEGREAGFLKFLEQKIPNLPGVDLFEFKDNGDIIRKTLDENDKIKREKC